MELQFEKAGWPCMMTAAAQAKSEEQTQEVRLGDNMPDIGRVLAAWGQVLLRGKEWRSSGMTISTGIMVWVLYAPEDGTQLRMVETWLPVQLKWDFPETKHDGTIIANCRLASVDARSTSARKLMIRGVVSVFAEAVVPESVDVWTPGTVPEDVQMLKRSYPVCLPREAGEKSFALDDTMTLPIPAAKLIRYSLQPEILDTNVVAGKAVFRGVCQAHILYEDPQGNLNTHDQEFLFSQFADLDQDYEADAKVRVVPAVTNLEVEMEEPDRLRLKAGLVGQFVVSDCTVMELVEDAYSNRRPVTVQREQLMIPAELEQNTQNICLTAEEPLEADRLLDTTFLCGHLRIRREDNGVELEQNGSFQLLYESAGELRGKVVNGEEMLHINMDHEAAIRASSNAVGIPQTHLGNRQATLRSEMAIHTVTTTDQGIPMVTGLILGETTQPDPNRPSMILRRANGDELWDLAKKAGSTVEQIMRINQLQGEPEEDRLLLIPVS